MWQFEGDDKTQIDDAKVTDLLDKFKPLMPTSMSNRQERRARQI